MITFCNDIQYSIHTHTHTHTHIMTTQQCEYGKLNDYHDGDKFKFDLEAQPTITEFEEFIGEKMTNAGRCVLNTPDNFPLKLDKDGTPLKRQREYFTDDTEFTGKKVDYIANHESWSNGEHEWLYGLAYNGHIVKIGMTITSLQDRWSGSYSCGTSRAMSKGSCSTTNYIITECNFKAIHHHGMNVEIYGICCPKKKEVETRFGVTKTIYTSTVRGLETMLTERFVNKCGFKPVLCVQLGK